MSALNNVRGVPLGGDKPLMPEVTVYPFADVDVIPGTIDHTDATHWLRIFLPTNGREIRIPYSIPALARLATICHNASAGGTQPAGGKRGVL
jgi:hypothetical protein